METQNDRVERSTPRGINRKIEDQLLENIRYYSKAGTAELSERIEELEREWYMDRMLITNASALAGVGLLLGAKVNPKWFFMSGVVLTFLLQHGLQGWCPPLPLFRLLGVRSFKEIDRERFALKYLRGDFDDLQAGGGGNANKLFAAVSR